MSKAVIKLTNGFYNQGNGYMMTGTLLNGIVEKGDFLIVNSDMKIPIIDVAFDKDSNSIIITLQKEMQDGIGNNWRGNKFEID